MLPLSIPIREKLRFSQLSAGLAAAAFICFLFSFFREYLDGCYFTNWWGANSATILFSVFLPLLVLCLLLAIFVDYRSAFRWGAFFFAASLVPILLLFQPFTFLDGMCRTIRKETTEEDWSSLFEEMASTEQQKENPLA